MKLSQIIAIAALLEGSEAVRRHHRHHHVHRPEFMQVAKTDILQADPKFAAL